MRWVTRKHGVVHRMIHLKAWCDPPHESHESIIIHNLSCVTKKTNFNLSLPYF
jgi:hypothetical protein